MPIRATKRSNTNYQSGAMQEMLQHATEAAEFLKALANDQRLAILCTLIDGQKSVGQINERVQLSQSALSQHLAILRERELVVTDKQAQTVYYALPAGKTRRILDVLHDCFCAS
ncbi:MAG: ArsR/SmtB family transcription factor [Steroidobacteraceae bacterium]